jgi:lipopolysaccharide transport system ATP-binding protein
MIHLDHVAKHYVLKPQGASALLQRLRHRLPIHWALRDVNLHIPEGQSVALLGINGSGKSTLLRLINGITPPSRGSVRVAGRVGGLLDLTAGLHLDLNGIENIYLQGALIGIPRSEITARLDDIIAFAELAPFIHTPVRHYSWGMLMRLAFAITLRCDPDVMLIDEVLAVGDGYFQWKCMREIEKMKAAGKTIVFVTHLPGLAEAMCSHAIWLDDGVVRATGTVTDVLGEYQPFVHRAVTEFDPIAFNPRLGALLSAYRAGTGKVVLSKIRFLDAEARETLVFQSGGPMEIEVSVVAKSAVENVTLCIVVHTAGQAVSEMYSSEHGRAFDLPEGPSVLRWRIPSVPLHGETYYISIGLMDANDLTHIYDSHIRLHSFTVTEENTFGWSSRVLRLPARLEAAPVGQPDTAPTPGSGGPGLNQIGKE